MRLAVGRMAKQTWSVEGLRLTLQGLDACAFAWLASCLRRHRRHCRSRSTPVGRRIILFFCLFPCIYAGCRGLNNGRVVGHTTTPSGCVCLRPCRAWGRAVEHGAARARPSRPGRPVGRWRPGARGGGGTPRSGHGRNRRPGPPPPPPRRRRHRRRHRRHRWCWCWCWCWCCHDGWAAPRRRGGRGVRSRAAGAHPRGALSTPRQRLYCNGSICRRTPWRCGLPAPATCFTPRKRSEREWLW